MDKEKIIALARVREKAANVVSMYGQQNIYGLSSYEDQIAASARLRIAKDALAQAEKEYGEAISSLTAQQLSELLD